MRRSFTIVSLILVSVALALAAQQPGHVATQLSEPPIIDQEIDRIVAIQGRNETAILANPFVRAIGIGREVAVAIK